MVLGFVAILSIANLALGYALAVYLAQHGVGPRGWRRSAAANPHDGAGDASTASDGFDDASGDFGQDEEEPEEEEEEDPDGLIAAALSSLPLETAAPVATHATPSATSPSNAPPVPQPAESTEVPETAADEDSISRAVPPAASESVHIAREPVEPPPVSPDAPQVPLAAAEVADDTPAASVEDSPASQASPPMAVENPEGTVPDKQAILAAMQASAAEVTRPSAEPEAEKTPPPNLLHGVEPEVLAGIEAFRAQLAGMKDQVVPVES
jgi:hypothetical protein